MRQQSTRNQSREQWKRKAKERAEENRYLRTELARIRHERDRSQHAHQETQEHVRQSAAQVSGRGVSSKVDLVWLALRLFLSTWTKISMHLRCMKINLIIYVIANKNILYRLA